MKFTLEIDMDTAAFEDNPSELEELLDAVREGVTWLETGKLRDSNGNTVGSWRIEG